MVDVRDAPVQRRAAPALVMAVKQLWWGAMIVFVNFKVAGWDLSSDMVGMALITWACFKLYQVRPSDKLGQAGLALAVTTLVFTVVYSIPATGGVWAEIVSSTFGGAGIVVVALYLARLLRGDDLDHLASKWETTARWNAAAAMSGLAFAAVVYLGGGFDAAGGDVDAVFDWAIDTPVALVVLIVLLALGTIAGVTWIRAAWSTWR